MRASYASGITTILLVLFLISGLGFQSFMPMVDVKAQIEQFQEPSNNQPDTITNSEKGLWMPWGEFWRYFRSVSMWSLEWYNGTAWVSKRSYLTLQVTYPYENTSKITLIFRSVEAGSYRLIFAIDERVLNYVEKIDKWQYQLIFRQFNATLDWSDIKDISGLTIRYGIREGFFWFTIRRDNIPSGFSVVLDPRTIIDQDSQTATRWESQRKTFLNPRGQGYYYAMFYSKNSSSSKYQVVFYKSLNGLAWLNETTIKSFASDVWESGSLYYVQDSSNSQLIVFFTYADTNGNLFYKRGTIADSGTTIALGSEITLLTGGSNDKAYRPSITFNNSRVWISYRRLNAPDLTEALAVNGFDNYYTGWTRTGSSPYLSTINYPTSYVSTSVTNDDIGYFSFADSSYFGVYQYGTITLRIYARQEAGGNDQIQPSIRIGGASDNWVTPARTVSTSWGYLEWDVTGLISAGAGVGGINAATIRIRKLTVGSMNDVEVDYAELRVDWVTSTYEVRLRASTVANPNSTQWSSEYLLRGTESNEKLTPVLINLPNNINGYQVLATYVYETPTLNDHYIRGVELKWNDSAFTKGSDVGYSVGSGFMWHYGVEQTSNAYVGYWIIQSVVDEGVQYWSNAFALLNWTVGSGFSIVSSFSELVQPTSQNWRTMSLTIDRTAATNLFVVFYAKNSPTNRIFWRTYSIGGGSTFDSEQYATEGANELLNDISTSIRDSNGEMQLIYTTSTTAKVRFWKYPPKFWVQFYFHTGGSLRVNGTTTANGTTTWYSINNVVNITGVPSIGYLFKNHTYDSSSTTNNPFYLTITKDFTTHSYFRFLFDCNYIGTNNSLAGNTTEFSSDWTDLKNAEGISKWLISNNNTGSWQNSTWSGVWINNVWAKKTYSLSSTANMIIAFRFYVNNTSGYVYASTIAFIKTQTVFGTGGGVVTDYGWELGEAVVAVLIFGVIIFLLIVFLVFRRR